MKAVFTKEDIDKIAKALCTDAKSKGNFYRLELHNQERAVKLSVEIFPNIQIGEKTGNLITVYAPCTHLQLHFCTGYVVSELLGEVTFISETEEKLSGLIIEKGGGANLYSNVDRAILSGDFTTLGPEVMLSGVALSLAEDVILPDNA